MSHPDVGAPDEAEQALSEFLVHRRSACNVLAVRQAGKSEHGLGEDPGLRPLFEANQSESMVGVRELPANLPARMGCWAVS